MAILAGGMGFAFRDRNQGVAIESAQGAVASLLSDARARAVRERVRTMLVVEVDPANESFLRSLHVAAETVSDSNDWRITADEILLHPGIFVVPRDGSLASVGFHPGPESSGVWPEGHHSTLSLLSPDGHRGAYLGMTVPLSNVGKSGAGGGDKFVLAVGRQSSAGVIFEHAERVKGVALSIYGVPILVNDAAGFDF